jgi:hypothetical protein
MNKGRKMKNQIPGQLSFDYMNSQHKNDVVSSVKEKNFPYCEHCDSESISFVKEHRNNKDISILCLDCQMVSTVEFSTVAQKNDSVQFLKEIDLIRRDKEWERKYDQERGGRITPLIPPIPKGWDNSWYWM